MENIIVYAVFHYCWKCPNHKSANSLNNFLKEELRGKKTSLNPSNFYKIFNLSKSQSELVT